jgi:hypothetical protein
MQDWHSTCLGRRTLPRDLSAFEIETFFNFSDPERRVIEDRRGPALKLALALQIGFLRMTGRLLEAVRIVPPRCGGIWGSSSVDFSSLCPILQQFMARGSRALALLLASRQSAAADVAFLTSTLASAFGCSNSSRDSVRPCRREQPHRFRARDVGRAFAQAPTVRHYLRRCARCPTNQSPRRQCRWPAADGRAGH